MQQLRSLVPRAVQRLAAVSVSVLAIACICLAQGPAGPQTPVQSIRGPAFRAVSYDVFASLTPAGQMLSVKATVEFEARELSRTLEFELHPNLRIRAVQDADGNPVDFHRDALNSLSVRVFLPDVIGGGQRTRLMLEYAGPLANEVNSPVKGVRLAWIGNDGAYLLLPARWFPLTDYPTNRYTGTFHLEVPETFAVVGTGESEGPRRVEPVELTEPAAASDAGVVAQTVSPPVLGNATPEGTAADAESRIVYTFQVDRPEAAGTFVAGALQLNPVRVGGLEIAVYTPPDATATAPLHGEAVARIVGEFSGQFGPLPEPNLSVAQIPNGTVSSFAAPGLLLVSQRQWLAMPNERLLANLVASQWWGGLVTAAAPDDAWLTTGLARYSEALYVERTAGEGGMNKVLEDFAIGALMFEDAAPISEAGRLEPFTPGYTSVVANKGAMVFHMLRAQLGDTTFFSLLSDFLAQFKDRPATLSDFEMLAEARAERLGAPVEPPGFVLRSDSGSEGATTTPPRAASGGAGDEAVNLRPFFAQWINSTGIPEFSISYTVYRTRSGFKLIGKVEQDLDFFRMLVEIEVQTEGNPEYETIQVTGTESSFDLDVFGRPKPNGIVFDPHNYILKSSPRLRMRSVIARGEALAEEGRYYDAIRQYSQALDIERNNALAAFRMGEAFFYQKNYSAAANAFRDALDGDMELNYRWVEVWSRIYLGKIYDISGDRARAVNEYSKAEQTNDNTGGALDEARKYIAQPYSDRPA